MPAAPWWTLVRPALAGGVFGYVALHPISMLVFQWLDPRIAHAHRGTTGGLLDPIAHSFQLGMLPMGVVFAFIGGAIAVFYARHRVMLTLQRDLLAEELARNEAMGRELARQAEILNERNEELARLELANRRTSQFMAHDFKTGLGCVAGFANELLNRHDLQRDPDVAAALIRIRRQAHQMMGGVMDLLEFARAREGVRPRMQLISATTLLQEAVNDFALPAHAEHITVGDNHRQCPPFFAEPRLLRRVLCNLISNAVTHNRRGTHVWLDAQVQPSGQEVLFSCCDDGSGIEPEVLPTIFDFASRGDPSGQSTGLGLAFCKSVVEAHGGKIWCESVPEKGARFFFTVPLRKEWNDDE